MGKYNEVLTKMADVHDKQSFSSRMRKKRMDFFFSVFGTENLTILDIGGTKDFWNNLDVSLKNVHITLVNYDGVNNGDDSRFTMMVGDGRSMPQFKDKSFDIVFSNSVIEHVGSFPDQKKMAEEVKRIGKSYYIQTPNRYFPIEPHYQVPLFQFFPSWLKMFTVSKMTHEHDPEKLKQHVDRIHLLSGREMRTLFPDACIYREILWGLTKSFCMYKKNNQQPGL
jgi:ubiquinone/menaquinone biosynthesis C-methylase UbiE